VWLRCTVLIRPSRSRRCSPHGGSFAGSLVDEIVVTPIDRAQARIDATELLAIAGHRTKPVEYLLGNHVIAESMFRYDAHALLYAPLRVIGVDAAAAFAQ
jgi:hypothetical protein